MIGVFFPVLGIVLMVAQYRANPDFFRRRIEVADSLHPRPRLTRR